MAPHVALLIVLKHKIVPKVLDLSANRSCQWQHTHHSTDYRKTCKSSEILMHKSRFTSKLAAISAAGSAIHPLYLCKQIRHRYKTLLLLRCCSFLTLIGCLGCFTVFTINAAVAL